MEKIFSKEWTLECGLRIPGDLYFSDYEHFTAFVNFVGNINTKTPMKLYYSTNGHSHDNPLESEWYKLVLINELKKSEIDYKTGFLKCEVKFEMLCVIYCYYNK